MISSRLSTKKTTKFRANSHSALSTRFCADSVVRSDHLREQYLFYACFNQYDPFEGVSTDPQSLHKYNYADSDPVNNVDPSGLFSLTEVNVTSGINNILTAISKVSRVLNTVNRLQQAFSTFQTILKLASGDFLDLVQQVTAQYAGGFGDFAQQFTLQKIREGLGTLLGNGPAVVARLATHPNKIEQIIEALRSSDAALAIMMPTPPKPLPNPFGVFPTGLKIRFGGSLEIPVKIFFGRDKWWGRFVGIGIMKSPGDKDPEQIFRMDYRVGHGQFDLTPGDFDHWGTSDGRYEFHIPR